MHAANFFVPSFLKAISDNTEGSLRNIMNEVSPGIYVFEMLQPYFCELLLSEVPSLLSLLHAYLFTLRFWYVSSYQFLII